jgi:hypothetical protein
MLTTGQRQGILTVMDDLSRTRDSLNVQLDAVVQADALAALEKIGALQRDLEERQGEAVRAAAASHTWAEIGEALGVSKQAAHQKFAKEWANTLKAELKSEHKAMKTALRDGNREIVASTRAKRDAIVSEFKSVARAQRNKM